MKKNLDAVRINRYHSMVILLVFLLVAPGFNQFINPPVFRVIATHAKGEIVIDGSLDEPDWQKTAIASDFYALGENSEPASPYTSVKILTDGKNLLLGFSCLEPDMAHLKSSPKPRDGDVFHDDSVEVVIDPTNERKVLFHLISNVNGSQYDTSGTIQGSAVTEYKEWNGSWEAAASKKGDAWFSEWKIPLSDIGVKTDFPVSMGINVCRARFHDAADYSSWFPCRMRFTEPDRLGDLILTTDSNECYLMDFPWMAVFSANHSLPQIKIYNLYNVPKKFRLNFILKSSYASEKTASSEDFSMMSKGSKGVSSPLVPGEKGFYLLLLQLVDTETGSPVNAFARYFEVKPELEILMRPFLLYSNRMEGVVNICHPEAVNPGASLSVSLFRETEDKPLEVVNKEMSKNANEPVGLPLYEKPARFFNIPGFGYAYYYNEPFSFSLEGKPEGRYLVKAEFFLKDRLLSTEQGSPLSYTPNPQFGFTKDGFLKVDGNPFFPVGMYTLQSRTPGLSHDDVLKEAREAGFNMTVFYAYKIPDLIKLLDAAERNHMPAFVYGSDPYKIRTGKWTPEEVSHDLESRIHHPALLGWYLVDEPEGIGKTNQDTLRRLYETMKAKDMNHPCSLVIMSPHAASVYGFHSDIVWVDPYPVPDRPATFVSERIDGVIKAVKGERPVWAVLQAFDWNKWRKGVIDKVHRPTPEEERCMTYLALVHGAKGIIYWAHTASRYYIRDYPEHWSYMKRLAGELRDLSPVLLDTEKAPDIQISPNQVPLDTMVKMHEGSVYVFAVNREITPCEATLGFKDIKDSAVVDVLFENRSLKVQSGGWKDTFTPLEVHVYKIPAP